MEVAAEIAVRLDTEDFLTPESDAALETVLDALERHGATATFPLVAEKLRSWERRGRRHLVARLARHTVGYHSDTHSVHPTISEELAPLTFGEGQAAFAAREAAGFAEVRAAFGPLRCWTQPGGNWTAAALPVMRKLGVPLEFSESWNSYLDVGSRPWHYCGMLHWSPPVRAPKPFLSALPGCLAEALGMVREALEAEPGSGPPLCVVAHPTELCTTTFWDAVNFARGRRPAPSEWRPAPVRPPEEVAAAAAAFDRYVGELRAMGLRFVTAVDLAARYPDRAPGAVLSPERVLALAPCALPAASWAVCGALALSAAEVLGVLCHALSHPADQGWAVRYVAGPEEAPPARERLAGQVARSAVVAAAGWCARFVAERGCVPATVPVERGRAAPADFLAAVGRALLEPGVECLLLEPRGVAADAHVKPPAQLHWDWPIFPEGFAPMGLWRQAKLQAWTLKPALPIAAARSGAAGWRSAPDGTDVSRRSLPQGRLDHGTTWRVACGCATPPGDA